MKFQKTLGLEVHAQINTKTKLFSRALVDDLAEPNTQVDFLDAGFPGTLPVPNEEAILMGVKTCLALNMEINKVSVFDRKHYFYQDLPLGYQITQFYKPIGVNGFVDCSFGRVRINRLHIEADAGKSIYKNGCTYIDLNRAGVGLMEIVTEPDFSSEDQVIEYLKELRSILLALNTCKCDMEKGNFRVDVNLSLAEFGSERLGTRVEIKNLNSFSTIRKAILAEEKIQIEKLNSGIEVEQETKLFDIDSNLTKTIRSKENSADYKYFPDTDLLPVKISSDIIENIRKNLPILPKQMREILFSNNIAKEQAYVLTESVVRFNFLQELIAKLTVLFSNISEDCVIKDVSEIYVKVSNWICSELLGRLGKLDIELEVFLQDKGYFIDNFARIIELFEKGEVTRSVAKSLLDEIIKNDVEFDVLFKDSELLKKVDFNLDEIIDRILDNSSDEIEKFRKGKVQIVMYFVGLVMKETGGKLNVEEIKEKILIKLNERIA